MALFECFFFQYHSPKILLFSKLDRKKRNSNGANFEERESPNKNLGFGISSYFKMALFECFFFQYHSPKILLFSKLDRKKRNSNGANFEERESPKKNLGFGISSYFKMVLFECFFFQYHSPKILLFSKLDRKKRNSNG